MTDLIKIDGSGYNVAQIDESEEVRELLRGARATTTRKVYGRCIAAFSTWCDARDAQPLPAEPKLVREYIAYLRRRALAPSTVNLHLSAIAHAHRHAGLGFDTALFEGVMDGVRRLNKRKPKKAQPATLDVVEDAVADLPADLRGLRDRAIILLGFWAARRRSELSGLDATAKLTAGATGHIEFVPEGLVIRLAVSKTNQKGDTEDYAVPLGCEPCAVATVRAWLDAAGIKDGALFRQINRHGKVGGRISGHSINAILKDRLGSKFTGHALRRGFLTEGARSGMTGLELAQQSGHASQDMVNEYVREADLFKANAAAKLSARRRGC